MVLVCNDIVKKNVTLLVVGLLVVGGGWWIWKQLSKPLPGQKVDDMGRQHVADISDVAYNSNPPTSGPHFALWLKPGVYDRVVSDGYLIHSLEHGYVVISYNCGSIGAGEQESVSAEATGSALVPAGTGQARPLTRSAAPPSAAMSWFTPENPPAKEVELPEVFSSEECRKLVEDLRGFVQRGKRVVIVPRPGMDALVALTAWNRILKLERMDKGEIEDFIGAFHNRGPEKTVE